jgi:PKD repeat protein
MRSPRRLVLAAAVVACLLAILLAPASAAAGSADTPAGGGDTPAALAAVDRGGTLASVTARCELSPTSVAPGESVTIDASASQDADLYRYDPFGTGEFSDFADRATRTVTYQEVGTYEPRVRAINATAETTDQVVCGTLTVASTSENQKPTADLSYSPTEPAPDQAVSFTAEASDPDGEVVAYTWLVDGEPAAEGPDFEYAFPGPGNYTVGVRVTDDDGATGTVNRTVTVESVDVVARCELSATSIAPGESVTLDASASQDASAYRYDMFGTGEFGELVDRASRTVTYQEVGTYEPRVRAVALPTEDTDQAVCGELTVASTGENQAPTAEVSYSPSEPVAGEPVAFSADATDPDDDLLEYDWRVNGEQVSVYPEFEYTFDGPGEYEVAVTVSDGDGGADTVRRVVTVAGTSENQLPTADFSVTPQEPTPGAETTFVADASDPDGEVVEYTWQIDGQRVAGGSEFTVSLPEAGEYEVRLTATDDDGGVATATKTVTVSESGTNQPPTADFAVDPPAPAPGETVAFEATASDSDGSVGGYQWRIDGSVVAEGPDFEYAFPDRGEYTVALTVTDDDGATASASREVTVDGEERTQTATPQPTATPTPREDLTLSAAWWHSPTVPLRGEPVTLVASGPTDPAVTYRWDVDDDGSYETSGALASHVFTTAGDHAVTLQATLPDGSTETTTEAVAVADETVSQPGTGATVLWHAPVNPQPGETVTLVADVRADDETVTAYRWDLDDDGGTDAGGEVVAHTYQTEGRYTARLTVEYANGSTTTGADTVVVGDPTAATATATLSPAPTRTTTDGGTATGTSVGGTTGGGSPGFGILAGFAAFALLAARLLTVSR